MLEIKARAKINLSLKITGKRDGMHTLESVMMPVDFYDSVYLEERSDGKIVLSYQGKEGVFPNDTALKAAELITKKYELGGADIRIVKRIPEGAGLGGSSADAAAVARGLERLYGYGSTETGLLAKIGSDVFSMYTDVPCMIGGIGEKATPLSIKRKIYFAVLLSDDKVDTAECYGLFDTVGSGVKDYDSVADKLVSGEYFTPYNDLAKAAEILCPSIEERLKILADVGFLSGMTGSGSAVFGYEYDEIALKKKLNLLEKTYGNKFKTITF